MTSRTEVEPGRYREVALMDLASGTLMVPDRLTVDGDVPSAWFTLRPASGERDGDREWRDVSAWLSAVALSCAERGDFMVVELGGWDHRPHPYALFAHERVDGRSLSHLEVAPAPVPGHDPWPSPPEHLESAVLTAPATRENIAVVGTVLVAGVTPWARSPLDLAVTFGANPDGPIDLGTRPLAPHP